jgi:DNA-binding XRE family transcriptional regulator
VGPKTLRSRKPTPYPAAPGTLGDHLLKRRHELGLLQKHVAPSIGVNSWTLANWEKGYTNPKIRFWPRIIQFLGYDPNPEPIDLPQELFSARRRRGLSIRDLAKQLGVDPETLRRWGRGIRIPRGRWLELVEEFLRGH